MYDDLIVPYFTAYMKFVSGCVVCCVETDILQLEMCAVVLSVVLRRTHYSVQLEM